MKNPLRPIRFGAPELPPATPAAAQSAPSAQPVAERREFGGLKPRTRQLLRAISPSGLTRQMKRTSSLLHQRTTTGKPLMAHDTVAAEAQALAPAPLSAHPSEILSGMQFDPAMQQALARVTPSTAASRPNASLAVAGASPLSDHAGFVKLVEDRFVSPHTAPDRRASHDAVALAARIMAACPGRSFEPGLAYADAVLFAEALCTATHGDLQRASETLTRLQHGLALPSNATRRPMGGVLSAADQSAENDAWRAAQLLARTAGGYEILQQMAGADWPDPESPARHAPRVLLQAADALVEATDCEAGPQGFLERSYSIAKDVHAPIAPRNERHLATMMQAAAKLWQTGDGDALLAHEKGAVFAGMQGFFSDGPGTPFAAAKGRLLRTLNAMIPRASTPRRLSMPLRVFGKHANPFAVVAKGVHSAHLGNIGQGRTALDNATREIIAALHDASQGPATMQHSTRHALTSIVQQAEIQYVQEHKPSAAYGDMLPDSAYEIIAARTSAIIADLPPPAADAGRRERRVCAMLQNFRDKLDDPRQRPQAIAQIQKRLGDASNILDYDKLAAWRRWLPADHDVGVSVAFDTVERFALGHGIQPVDLTTEELHAVFDELTDNMTSDSKVILTDGGRIGLSTRGLSANLARVLHWTGGLLSPRVDMRVARGRQAYFEYARSSIGFDASLGTQRKLAWQAGGGAKVGHDVTIHGVGLRAAISMESAWWQSEATERRGLTLRVARRANASGAGYDDEACRRGIHDINAFLFDSAHAQRDLTAEQLWDRLADRFWQNDDISVAWNNDHQRSMRRTVSMSGGLSVETGLRDMTVRVGPRIGYTRERTLHANADRQDESGHRRAESHRFEVGRNTYRNTGINISVGDSGGRNGPASFGLISTDAPDLRTEMSRRRHGVKATLVRDDGKLQHQVSYAETEFTQLDDYAEALRTNPAWALLLGAGRHPLWAQDPGEFAQAMVAGRRIIEDHLAFLQENRRPNQIFLLRMRLRSNAAQALDAHEDRIITLRAGHAEEAEAAGLEHAGQALLARSDSWIPAKLKVYERVDAQDQHGIFFGVHAAAEKGLSAERELVSHTLKPAELDMLDAMWPRQAQ